MIPYGKQNISEQDIQEVVEVLKSDFLTQGHVVPRFEQKILEYTGSNHSVVVNSATSALHIACRALDVGSRDIVWTSANTFAASSNCALYCGASVDFIDIDPLTFNISTKDLQKKLEVAKDSNQLPKVVIPVHMCGQSCNMKEIYNLSKQYNFSIIEDASHAIGGKYLGKPIGSCLYSDITVFSFHPVKIITTGEGGAAVTNDIALAEKMRLLRSHGITRDPNRMKHNQNQGSWYYEQIDLGFNYRMTEIQAALGLSQMNRLDEFVITRHKIADQYNKLLADLPLELPLQTEESYSSFHLYVIRLQLKKIKKSHKQIFEELRNEGLGVNLHYIPVYQHPFYKDLGFSDGYCPSAESYSNECISIPIFPDLTFKEQEEVARIFKKVIC